MTATGQRSESAESPTDIRVYVNEQGVSVPHGSTALDAVRAFAPAQAEALAAGAFRLSDSRGLPVEATIPVHGGMILRVVPVRVGPERSA